MRRWVKAEVGTGVGTAPRAPAVRAVGWGGDGKGMVDAFRKYQVRSQFTPKLISPVVGNHVLVCWGQT